MDDNFHRDTHIESLFRTIPNNCPIDKEFVYSLFLNNKTDILNGKYQIQELLNIAEILFNFITNGFSDNDYLNIEITPINTSETSKNSCHLIIKLLVVNFGNLIDIIRLIFDIPNIIVINLLTMFIKSTRNKKDNKLHTIEYCDPSSSNELCIYIEISCDNQTLNEQEIYKIIYNTITLFYNKRSQQKKMVELFDKYQNYISDTYSTNTDSIESIEFLNWLQNDNFILLDHASSSHQKEDSCVISHNFVDNYVEYRHTLSSNNFNDILVFDYVTNKSEYKILDKCLAISILIYNNEKNTLTTNTFLGLLNYNAYNAMKYNIKSVPIIRHKIFRIEKDKNLENNNNKGVLKIIENCSPYLLIILDTESILIYATSILSHLFNTESIKLTYQFGINSILYMTLFIKTEDYNSKLYSYLSAVITKFIRSKIIDCYVIKEMYNLTRLHLTILLDTDVEFTDQDAKTIQNEMTKVVKNWYDRLFNELCNKFSFEKANKLMNKYKLVFPLDYRENFDVSNIYHDIIKIEQLLENRSNGIYNIATALYSVPSDTSRCLQLKIYIKNNPISLSYIMPIIENITTHVFAHRIYEIFFDNNLTIYIHHFKLQWNISTKIILNDNTKLLFENALFKILNHEIENCVLNKLVLLAQITWREIFLISAFNAYIKQIGCKYNDIYVQSTIVKYPELTSLLLKLFHARFDIRLKDNTERSSDKIKHEIENILSEIANINEDTVMRTLLEVILAITRTNYYQLTSTKNHKNYLSFKINSCKISIMPLPRPFAEIFVYCSFMEGVHLRGGKVARGGLRWSDRSEDYRTEILGLMKAQTTKNTIIVPVGSKGGFITKTDLSTADKSQYFEEGIKCYKVFLRGLLDITDNIINDAIVHPENLVIYDDDDPYLVVAADKGTSSFPDYANEVAENEYSFWLGDAFASGGSMGYDHKKMAITARGVFVSVKRHFAELGIDIEKTEFTVLGIGDMSGDVFGNGMLLSKKIKLIAAFNHIHIFIDPDPNTSESFEERKRLFNTPNSTWKDYDSKIMSKGGVVFNKHDKLLNLTPQIKKMLNLHCDTITPDALIRTLLKTPVDLLWNGGIGTFVKSEHETNDMVFDKLNDNIRINGADLGVKVVAEGGNLGFTQLGRIEFAHKGGKINTDFVDNSSGVGCSDREVNIKIVLRRAIELKKITFLERNAMLEEMKDQVTELVLKDNKLQNKIITIEELNSVDRLEQHYRFMKYLNKHNLMNNQLEYLPSDKQIKQMLLEKKRGFTRPELAVLLSYAKIWLYDEILRSKVPDEEYFDQYLLHHFPNIMQKTCAMEIQQHPLRREIIATYLTNSIINRVGIAFIYSIADNTGVPVCDITRSYIAIRDSYDLRDIWHQIEALESTNLGTLRAQISQEAQLFICNSIYWLLRNSSQPIDIKKSSESLTDGISQISNSLEDLLTANMLEKFWDKYNTLLGYNISSYLAKKLSGLDFLGAALGTIQIHSNNKDVNLLDITKLYFVIEEYLGINWIKNILKSMTKTSYWSELAVKTLLDNVTDFHTYITQSIVCQYSEQINDYDSVINQWVKSHSKRLAIYNNFVQYIKSSSVITIDAMVVLVQYLSLIGKNQC